MPTWGGCRRWVYPRAGGGTTHAYKEAHYATGLSPRRRGNRVRTAEWHLE